MRYSAQEYFFPREKKNPSRENFWFSAREKKNPSREKILETTREKSTVPVKFSPNPTRENQESGREKNPPHSANFSSLFWGKFSACHP